MYLGRFRQGDWVTLTFPKFHVGSGRHKDFLEDMQFPTPDVPDWSSVDALGQIYVAGTENPTLSVIDSSGNVVVEEKRMHLLDSSIDPALFTVSLFLGSDIPVGQCVAITEYVSKWERIRPSTGKRYPLVTERTHSFNYPFKVVPSGDPRGTYLSSYFYNRPHASFLLGQYDGDTLDSRKNPKE